MIQGKCPFERCACDWNIAIERLLDGAFLYPLWPPGLIVVITVSLFVCPLATGGYGLGYGLPRPAEARQIEFTPHVSTLEAEASPEPATLPTLGPGQFFSEDNKPKVISVHGDERFGWGDIPGNSNLVLIWVTDEEGTSYLAVEKGSDFFLGYLDKATNSRSADGFEDLVQQHDEKKEQFDAAGDEGFGSALAASVLLAGLALCPETGGAGCVAGIVGAFAVALGNTGRNFVRGLSLRSQLDVAEGNLLGKFKDAPAPPGT